MIQSKVIAIACAVLPRDISGLIHVKNSSVEFSVTAKKCFSRNITDEISVLRNGRWSFRPTTIRPRLFVLFFFFVQRLDFKGINFGPILKRSLVKGTLTLNPIGKKDVNEVSLDELSSVYAARYDQMYQ